MEPEEQIPQWHLADELRKKSQLAKNDSGSVKNSQKIIWFSILGVVLLVGALVVVFYSSRQTVKASKLQEVGASTPYAVRFVEVGSNEFTIEWKTQEKTIGYIKYGMSEDFIGVIGQETSDPGAYRDYHKITVDGLEPGQKYFVEIHSNAQAFGNSGEPLEIVTLD